MNLALADLSLFAHEFQKDFVSVTTLLLNDVDVLPNGFVRRALTPLPQSFALAPTGFRRVRIALRAHAAMDFNPTAARIDRGLFVTDEFPNGYFHWICDVLPRLEALAAAEEKELSTRILIVPAMADSSYVLPSLEPFGIAAPHVLGMHDRASCASLFAVPAVAPTGNYRPRLMEALRERFRRHFGAGTAKRRIFISRSEAAKRRIANEDEIFRCSCVMVSKGCTSKACLSPTR